MYIYSPLDLKWECFGSWTVSCVLFSGLLVLVPRLTLSTRGFLSRWFHLFHYTRLTPHQSKPTSFVRKPLSTFDSDLTRGSRDIPLPVQVRRLRVSHRSLSEVPRFVPDCPNPVLSPSPENVVHQFGSLVSTFRIGADRDVEVQV